MRVETQDGGNERPLPTRLHAGTKQVAVAEVNAVEVPDGHHPTRRNAGALGQGLDPKLHS